MRGVHVLIKLCKSSTKSSQLFLALRKNLFCNHAVLAYRTVTPYHEFIIYCFESMIVFKKDVDYILDILFSLNFYLVCIKSLQVVIVVVSGDNMSGMHTPNPDSPTIPKRGSTNNDNQHSVKEVVYKEYHVVK